MLKQSILLILFLLNLPRAWCSCNAPLGPCADFDPVNYAKGAAIGASFALTVIVCAKTACDKDPVRGACGIMWLGGGAGVALTSIFKTDASESLSQRLIDAIPYCVEGFSMGIDIATKAGEVGRFISRSCKLAEESGVASSKWPEVLAVSLTTGYSALLFANALGRKDFHPLPIRPSVPEDSHSMDNY
jgi:hypothetical protein